MQAPAARRILAPRAPGGEERKPETEAGFEDREGALPPPAGGQAVALQEHVPRLREAAFGAVIHVAVGFRIRCATGREGEADGNQGSAHPAIVRLDCRLSQYEEAP